jgi:hypothetical protein
MSGILAFCLTGATYSKDQTTESLVFDADTFVAGFSNTMNRHISS